MKEKLSNRLWEEVNGICDSRERLWAREFCGASFKGDPSKEEAVPVVDPERTPGLDLRLSGPPPLAVRASEMLWALHEE